MHVGMVRLDQYSWRYANIENWQFPVRHLPELPPNHPHMQNVWGICVYEGSDLR